VAKSLPESVMPQRSDSVDFDALRNDFPIFENSQQPLHYLDSAASSQKPRCVIDAINSCYREQYGPVHRGLYSLAEIASQDYETARQTLANFIKANNPEQIIFTRSATEAINLIAYGWARQHLKAGDLVWVSQMEHHSNFLPWQRVCREQGASLRIIPLDDAGRLDLDNADELFSSKTRFIAVTQVSNVLGVINPIRQIVEQASHYSIPVLVDAAQAVGHMQVDVEELGCDFLVASAHKMYGPTGVGLLYGKPQRLAETEPLLLGGGMVDEVRDMTSSWAAIPHRFEAGSPNLAGAIGFASAADYLLDIGWPTIENRVTELTGFAYEKLSSVVGLRIYGPAKNDTRAGIVSFNIDGIHPHDIAHVAAEHGVAIRAGHHCCQPLMHKLGTSSTARASFSFYNNEQDILALVNALQDAKQLFSA
jgi:cysteine desulfurase/selenocysteine lyase